MKPLKISKRYGNEEATRADIVAEENHLSKNTYDSSSQQNNHNSFKKKVSVGSNSRN
jgi:hypothetical protein